MWKNRCGCRLSGHDEDQGGFTLIELLVVMAITSVILTLGAFAIRHYWLVQSLEGAQGELLSQMRQRQVQAVSESHPLIFGVRVLQGSSEWGVVEYRPDDITTPSDESSCTEVQTNSFASGVEVDSVVIGASPEATYCQSSLRFSDLTVVPDRMASQYVMFYPRGTATSASVVLLQPTLGRTNSVSVTPVTGRATGS